MTPFVVSAKLVVDNTQGVRSIEEERAAFQRLSATIAGVPNLADRINASFGIGASGAGDRAADIAAYGASLDALRAKFNPLFAAERQHLDMLAQISSARRVGAIDVNEETAAIARETAAYTKLTQSMRNGTRGGAGTFQTANIAAQFQDIGVTAAMGMSPLQIALQQGTQLAPVLAELKAGTGIAQGLAAALGSILSPVSLITIGAVAAAAAAAQWLVPMVTNTETATERLERHVKAVQATIAGYKGAGDAIEDYLRTSTSSPSGVVAAELGAAFKQAQTDAKKFFSDIDTMRQSIQSSHFESLQKGDIAAAIRDLQLGKMTAGEFATRMAEIRLDPKTNGQAAALAGDLEKGAIAAGSLRDFLVAIDHSLAAVGHNQGVQIALDSMLAGKKSAEANQIELDAINAKSPAQLADIAMRREKLSLADQEMTDALRKQKVDEAGAVAYAQAAHGIAEADLQRLRAANDNIAAAQLDLQLIGKGIGETEQLRFVRERLAAAELEAAQNGTTVSAAYRAEVEKLGEAYGKLQQSIAIGKLQGDLAFARSQLGRSATEQDVAQQLRQLYGSDWQQFADGAVAQNIRINDTLTDIYNTGKSITSDILTQFEDKLASTGNLWQAFGAAGVAAFDDIAKKALETAAGEGWNWIWGLLTGGSTGATGGTFGNGLWGSAIFQPHASGTSNARGGLSRINEQGGEIVNLPDGTTVIPHDLSWQMAKNGGARGGDQFTFAPVSHFTVAGGGADIEAFQQMLDQRDRALNEHFAERVLDVIDNPSRRAAA